MNEQTALPADQFEVRVRGEPGCDLGLLDTVGSPMLAHRDASILYANAAMERLTGRTRAELYATPFHELAHADDRATWRECAMARLRGMATPTAFEIRLVSKDGEIRWVELKSTRIEIGGAPIIVCFIYDFTERKRAAAKELAMQRMLTQIIDGDPVPTFVINANHRVTHWNKACATITGIPTKEMVGTDRQWSAFYDAPRPCMVDLIIDGALEQDVAALYKGKFRRSPVVDGAFEAEDYFPRVGGIGRWLYFAAAPLRDGAGNIVGAIATLQDVSDRRRAEDELRAHRTELEQMVERRTAQLTSANEQLLQSEKLASIGQLAAGVAHEINNPIGYVHSNIGALEKYIGDILRLISAYEAAETAIAAPDRMAAIASLRREIDIDFLKSDIPLLVGESREGITRVKKIVQDLKDFSHVDTNEESQWADLHKGIDSTLNIVNNEVKYKADVVREYGDLPEVECRPSQLNQVFMNLLINAAHAMGETHGTITIRTGAADDHVWLEFADTGRGIPQDIRQRIFDPFFTTKPVGKGTGLGLSLSYGIIQKHHGSITVDSDVGVGTVFRIVLPRCQPPAASA